MGRGWDQGFLPLRDRHRDMRGESDGVGISVELGHKKEEYGLKESVVLGRSGCKSPESHENLVSQLKLALLIAGSDSLLHGEGSLETIEACTGSTSTGEFS